MSDPAFTRGGLFVGLAIAGIVLYELRTLLEFVGISVPLIPYLLVVIVLLAGTYVFAAMTNRLERPSESRAQ